MQDLLRFRARTRRAGNSIAVFVPADEARRIGLQPDRDVEVELRLRPESPLGLFKRMGLTRRQIDSIRRVSKRELWGDD